jgi:hypothetical protein
MISKRIRIVTSITILLVIIWYSIAYYQSVNFGALTEDAYVNYSTLDFFVFAFAILFLIIDILLVVDSLWSRWNKSHYLPEQTGES